MRRKKKKKINVKVVTRGNPWVIAFLRCKKNRTKLSIKSHGEDEMGGLVRT